jgi:predicted RND superfamily exporter protein
MIGDMLRADPAIAAGLDSLVGETHSRIILALNLPEESAATFDFISGLEAQLSGRLSGEYYLVGGSVMAYEMDGSFPGETTNITILTAAAIFLVVAIAFRSLSVPLILVCVIQCAIFITMGFASLLGKNIYYLALLIVQCLLMGATVDYGILYVAYYREHRQTMDVKESVVAALNGSIHTILTSSVILITVAGALGLMLAGSDPSISAILLIIARGGIFAAALVIFFLPGITAAFDRFVSGKNSVNK